MLPQQRLYSAEDYLVLERAAATRHEYWNGQILPMATSNRRHSLLCSNILASLNNQLRKKPCEVYGINMRLKVAETGLYTYPDGTVISARPMLEDFFADTLLNPTVLVEVFSPATECYDRGEKFRHYRTIPSLQEYLLVSQSKSLIEHYARQPNNAWLLTEFKEFNQVIELRSIECQLLVEEIYEKIE